MKETFVIANKHEKEMKEEEGTTKDSKRDASPPGVVTMAMLACKKITPRRLTPGL